MRIVYAIFACVHLSAPGNTGCRWAWTAISKSNEFIDYFPAPRNPQVMKSNVNQVNLTIVNDFLKVI